jgi:hypothetical protein
MKKLAIILMSLVIMFLISLGFSQNTEPVHHYQDNELQRKVVGQTEDIHCNPILLDGEPLDYETLNLESTGELTMVIGDPNHPNAERIPFYVQLRRNNSLGHIGDMKNYLTQSVYVLAVSKVLANAKGGDLLIITPTRPQDWKAKRIIKIKSSNC